MSLPGRLMRGYVLSADWLNRLRDAVQARTVNAGPGLAVTRTPSGTTISLARQVQEAADSETTTLDTVPAKVESFSSGVYKLALYADGLNSTATETGVEGTAMCVSFRSHLPEGTVVLAHRVPALELPTTEDEE